MRAGWIIVLALSLCACDENAEPSAVPESEPKAAASAGAPEGGRGERGPERGGPATGGPATGDPAKGGPAQRGPASERPNDLPDAPVPQRAQSVPDTRRCVSDCVDSNQMRAVSAEQIERDCRDECSSQCVAHCNSGSEAQKTACKADCEREASR
jgi:hypothetical protein